MNKKIQNATPKVYKGVTYRSKLEADCAKLLDEYNIFFEYEKFKINYIPSFEYRGYKFRKAQYTPDFVIGNNILEIKGWPNEIYRYKKKLVLLALEKAKELGHYYEFYEIHNLAQLKKWIMLYKSNKLNTVNGKEFL